VKFAVVLFVLNSDNTFAQNTQVTYTIKIKHFEGPFDLLLFFIERDELDIYDIPIAKITDDFLKYIREVEAMNIDVASEFIVVAATLMRIKARLLLPRKELDDLGNEIDPRDELVKRLLEYKRYKEILEQLRSHEDRRSKIVHRGNVTSELQKIANKALVDVELESVTLFKLLKAFSRVMSRFEESSHSAMHTMVRYQYTVSEQQDMILSALDKSVRAGFQEMFGKCENRIHAIVTFLALLELLNAQQVIITQGLGANNFWISYNLQGDEEE